MSTDYEKGEIVKNGAGVGKKRSPVYNKGWIIEFLQKMTAEDLEPMNEKPTQNLIKDREATGGVNGTNMKKEN